MPEKPVGIAQTISTFLFFIHRFIAEPALKPARAGIMYTRHCRNCTCWGIIAQNSKTAFVACVAHPKKDQYLSRLQQEES